MTDQRVSFGFEDIDASEKQDRVRGVFDRSARRYDLMNDLMSAGVHRAWKAMTMDRANPQPGQVHLDVAGGTGDLARAFVRRAQAHRQRRGGEPATAIVMDINEEMVRAGLKRAESGRPEIESRIHWTVGNAECLAVPDAAADCVTIAFGIRNVTFRDKALKEMHRVLKPGGRFLCLEFSRPTTRLLEALYDSWSFNAIPKLGDWIAKDEASYRYLVESIRRFPNQESFRREVEAAGFRRVAVTNFSGGIAALHSGWKV